MSFNRQLLSLEKAIISSPLSTPASTLHRERRSINVELLSSAKYRDNSKLRMTTFGGDLCPGSLSL